MINERLKKLRSLMAERNIDAYFIPTSDFHNSEYVGSYFKCRSYISNFDGSAGVVLVTQQEAMLWTDARYFIIAANAIKGNEFKLMKMFEPGVPSLMEWLKSNLKKGSTLGFDGRVVSFAEYKAFRANLDVKLKSDEDLIDLIWTERPALSNKPVFLFEEKYAGLSTQQKLSDIRDKMKEAECEYHLISTLDDNAWLFNMRGDDVSDSPLVLSYALISLDSATLYADKTRFSADLLEYLSNSQVIIKPYNDVYEDLKQLPKEANLLADSAVINSYLASCCAAHLENKPAPSTLMKAIKNDVEIENTRKAHLMDGVAVSKFMIWLKDEIKEHDITEIEAADKLEGFRREANSLIELSFETIAGYGANGASMHYTATPENFAVCKPENFLLVDSGGTYYEGTTDITRTFMLGPTKPLFKQHYTAVLRAMIDLSMSKFLYGVTGANLDAICRGPLWALELDYKHGTGHGVGHVSNVHEGPNNFHWNTKNRPSTILEAGMITSNEPGFYEEGSHGIRLENEILCCKGHANEYGQFMHFETLTLAPIDLDPVMIENLTQYEIAWLNEYHATVFEKVSPFLSESEQQKLKHYTRSI